MVPTTLSQDERADGYYVPVKESVRILEFYLGVGPWKGASGHTRPVREHWPSVAVNRRLMPGVHLPSASAVEGSIGDGLYELAGHN